VIAETIADRLPQLFYVAVHLPAPPYSWPIVGLDERIEFFERQTHEFHWLARALIVKMWCGMRHTFSSFSLKPNSLARQQSGSWDGVASSQRSPLQNSGFCSGGGVVEFCGCTLSQTVPSDGPYTGGPFLQIVGKTAERQVLESGALANCFSAFFLRLYSRGDSSAGRSTRGSGQIAHAWIRSCRDWDSMALAAARLSSHHLSACSRISLRLRAAALLRLVASLEPEAGLSEAVVLALACGSPCLAGAADGSEALAWSRVLNSQIFAPSEKLRADCSPISIFSFCGCLPGVCQVAAL
jgi:hypothetical protein